MRSSTPASAPCPVVGDVFDFAWKANDWNMALLERHAQPGTRASAGDWLFLTSLRARALGLALLPLLVILGFGWRPIRLGSVGGHDGENGANGF